MTTIIIIPHHHQLIITAIQLRSLISKTPHYPQVTISNPTSPSLTPRHHHHVTTTNTASPPLPPSIKDLPFPTPLSPPSFTHLPLNHHHPHLPTSPSTISTLIHTSPPPPSPPSSTHFNSPLPPSSSSSFSHKTSQTF